MLAGLIVEHQRRAQGMLGEDLVETYRIVQNDAFDPASQVCLGSTTWAMRFGSIGNWSPAIQKS